jgi:hypothetical protein
MRSEAIHQSNRDHGALLLLLLRGCVFWVWDGIFVRTSK